MKNARARFYPNRRYGYSERRRGIVWEGLDLEGRECAWYINAAAEFYGRRHLFNGYAGLPEIPLYGDITRMTDELDLPGSVQLLDQPCQPAEIEKLLAKHRLPIMNPVRSEFEGVVNEVWMAGDVVVRVNKNVHYESDVWTESVAVPALTARGIQTPNLVAFDHDLDIVPRLVTIYDRVPGVPLSKVESLPDPEAFFTSLGREIRRFHDRITEVDDPDERLDPQWTINMDAFRETLSREFPEALAILPPGLTFKNEEPGVFCHQDLHADNIMVHEGKLAAIIDWGDAGWADRSVDFRWTPARYLSAMFEGYGEISPSSKVNIAIHLLDQLLYSQRESRSYGVFGDSTKDEVLRVVRGLVEA